MANILAFREGILFSQFLTGATISKQTVLKFATNIPQQECIQEVMIVLSVLLKSINCTQRHAFRMSRKSIIVILLHVFACLFSFQGKSYVTAIQTIFKY